MDGVQTFKKSNRPMILFIGCCLLSGTAFTLPLTCFSVFVPPLIGMLQASVTQITLYFTLLSIGAIFSCIFGPRLLRINASAVVTIAAIIMGGGYIALATAPSVATVWVAGLLSGLCYPLTSSLLIPILINNWFAKNQGTFVGIAFAMVGIFGAIFSPIFTAIIQTTGIKSALIVMGVIIIVVIGLIGLFLVRLSPLAMGILPWGATQEEAQKIAAGNSAGPMKGANANLPGFEFKQIFSSPAFYLTVFACICFGFVGTMNTQLNTIVQVSGFDPVVAGIVVSALSVGMFIGKILNGAIKDRAGATVSILSACIIGIIAFISLACAIVYANVYLLYVAAFLAGFCTCLANVAPPLVTADTFGPKDYANILGVMTAMVNAGMAIATPIFASVFDSTGSYMPIIIAVIAVVVIELIACSCGIRQGQKFWKKPQQAD